MAGGGAMPVRILIGRKSPRGQGLGPTTLYGRQAGTRLARGRRARAALRNAAGIPRPARRILTSRNRRDGGGRRAAVGAQRCLWCRPRLMSESGLALRPILPREQPRHMSRDRAWASMIEARACLRRSQLLRPPEIPRRTAGFRSVLAPQLVWAYPKRHPKPGRVQPTAGIGPTGYQASTSARSPQHSAPPRHQ